MSHINFVADSFITVDVVKSLSSLFKREARSESWNSSAKLMSSAGLVRKNKVFLSGVLSYLNRDPLKSFKIPLVPQGNF